MEQCQPGYASSKLMSRSCPQLLPAEAAAYDAPFPDATYKGGVRRFPNLVPDNPDAEGAIISRQAREWWSTQWSGKTAMVIGMTDPVLRPTVMEEMRQFIRGCPAPVELNMAGHFVQEWGEDVLRGALKSGHGRLVDEQPRGIDANARGTPYNHD